ncbi:uncharacterized protein LAESUDRAFT_763465 [Laetiporus sulphureus 93-53]|uniref:t-SNARE coiled-coil homology domain-containing protein n=1 Tax=Laetiporus sulphureus 93-53 TaxID=1314785 RepID=A0A165BVF1_9APHY|nr:uncharacterized protein LAESUDRAFT_763465 [Laetiporus sulphureus 93-53]KZT01725.1 hypothetical protein LAESUDRAFT_763465 [Laetiporus sulphureus 93-53]
MCEIYKLAVQYELAVKGKGHGVATPLTVTWQYDVEERKAALRRINMELDEADGMASTAELQRNKKLAKGLHAQTSRADLLGGGRGGGVRGRGKMDMDAPLSGDPYGPRSDRTRLLAGTTLLEDSSRRLQESRSIVLETQEQGMDISSSLWVQRKQTQNARNTLQDADMSSDRVCDSLEKKIRRIYQQRVVVVLVRLRARHCALLQVFSF